MIYREEKQKEITTTTKGFVSYLFLSAHLLALRGYK
jgi:hypothetical protein